MLHSLVWWWFLETGEFSSTLLWPLAAVHKLTLVHLILWCGMTVRTQFSILCYLEGEMELQSFYFPVDWYGLLVRIQVTYVIDNDSRRISNLELLLSKFFFMFILEFFHLLADFYKSLILCSFHFILIKLWKAFLRNLFWLTINFKVFSLIIGFVIV